MINEKLRNQIKLLELKTRKILNGVVSGDHSTTVKGSGYEFDQIRPYEQGDDLRFIDWKSSAKVNKLLFKQYFDDKNREVVICVDVSSSVLYSTEKITKKELIDQIAAVLALMCEYGKDAVTLILFSDHVEEVVPSGLGVIQTQKIFNKLFNHKIKKNTKTDINFLGEYLIKNNYRNKMIFVVSDFISSGDYSKNLKLLNKFSEVVAIQCIDKLEISFVKAGIVNFVDIETGEKICLNTSKTELKYRDSVLKKIGIETLSLITNQDYVVELVKFFKRRLMY